MATSPAPTLPDSAPEANTLLRLRDIGKVFPGNVALCDVSLDIRAGEIHALMGEDGAGKSTLMKIIAGEYSATSGDIMIDGKILPSNFDAAKFGIGLVHQELSLVPALSVAENIYLGRLPRRFGSIDWRAAEKNARAILRRLGVDLDPRAPVGRLEVAEQQLVEIARVLERAPKIVLFDEPTSALSDSERTRLFDVIRLLKEEGHGVVYISHNLSEIMAIADRVTVLRDGRLAASLPVAEASEEKIVSLMVGQVMGQQFPKFESETGKDVLRVENLVSGTALKGVSFSLRQGEILGVYGLMGAGQAELAGAIFGLAPFDSGEIHVGETRLRDHSPADAIAARIGLLSRDRRQSLIPMQPIAPNLSLAWLSDRAMLSNLELGREKRESADYIRMMRIRPPSMTQKLLHYSGGNQQKVILARWMSSGSKILIFDEPTRGIDVGAKAEVFTIMSRLVEAGTSILMISSEINELVALADRVLVMRSGLIKVELTREQLSQEALLLHSH